MLILVFGLPGAGKSTVARLIAEELDAVVLNSDVVRRELFPVARTYSPRETGIVIKETERRVRNLLKEGKTVVSDALFTKEDQRARYRRLAEDEGAPFVPIYVHAPEGATRERMDRRAKAGDASEATFSYYLNRKPHFEEPEGKHFSIENAGDLEELRAEVRALIPELRER